MTVAGPSPYADSARKRALDLVVAGSAVLLLSPLFLLVAILIKLDSRGPVFYAARRCGRRRQPFSFFKFRTMVPNATAVGSAILTAKRDPRITRVGRFLRVLKIDELPQLVNVLRGDMSVVGPRPEVYEVVDTYYREQWTEVLEARPGITCLLQIETFPDFTIAHGGGADGERVYVEQQLPFKLRRDTEYVRTASLGLDLKIILQTAWCIGFKSWGYLLRGH